MDAQNGVANAMWIFRSSSGHVPALTEADTAYTEQHMAKYHHFIPVTTRGDYSSPWDVEDEPNWTQELALRMDALEVSCFFLDGFQHKVKDLNDQALFIRSDHSLVNSMPAFVARSSDGSSLLWVCWNPEGRTWLVQTDDAKGSNAGLAVTSRPYARPWTGLLSWREYNGLRWEPVQVHGTKVPTLLHASGFSDNSAASGVDHNGLFIVHPYTMPHHRSGTVMGGPEIRGPEGRRALQCPPQTTSQMRPNTSGRQSRRSSPSCQPVSPSVERTRFASVASVTDVTESISPRLMSCTLRTSQADQRQIVNRPCGSPRSACRAALSMSFHVVNLCEALRLRTGIA